MASQQVLDLLFKVRPLIREQFGLNYMIVDHEPSLTIDQSKFTNREPDSESEKRLIHNRFTLPLEKFRDEQRVWTSTIEDIGRVLLKSYAFSDVNCEAAAFIVSDVLHFNFVPRTVVRVIDGISYSVQEFISGAEPLTRATDKLFEQLYLIWIFDHVIRSNDREQFNILVSGDSLVAIDHEAAFYSLDHEEDYDTYKTFYELPCPADVLTLLKKIIDSEEQIRFKLKRDLIGLLSEKDIEETLRRIFYIAKLAVSQGMIKSLSALSM